MISIRKMIDEVPENKLQRVCKDMAKYLDRYSSTKGLESKPSNTNL
jgi:hypothetical protein